MLLLVHGVGGEKKADVGSWKRGTEGDLASGIIYSSACHVVTVAYLPTCSSSTMLSRN